MFGWLFVFVRACVYVFVVWVGVRACVRACVRAWVGACVRACVHACVRACRVAQPGGHVCHAPSQLLVTFLSN